MDIVAAAAAEYAAAGYFTIIDGIVSPAWFFEPLRDSLRTAGHTVAYAVLRAPPSVCRGRLEGREAHGVTEAQVVERLWRDFADLGPLEEHVIDTEIHSASETVQLLEEGLRSGRLVL